MPLTFETLLNHICARSQRDKTRHQLNSADELSEKDINDNITNFHKLFNSHDLDAATELHADNIYFCKNIKDI